MWQPIETAPKDRTRIDLWIVKFGVDNKPLRGWRVADAFWNEHAWVVWCLTRMPDGTDETDEYAIADTATHWMPLPEPPPGSAQ